MDGRPEQTDAELVRAYRDGDGDAFTELLDRHIGAVFVFVKRLCGDASMADDVAQETFVKAWKGIGRFDEGRNFKAWLFAIARNAAIDALRKRRDVSFSRMSEDLQEDDRFEDAIEDESPLPGEGFDRAIDGKTLERALSLLSPEKRAIVLMHDVEGLTFEEAAEALGEPMNTVKSRYRRSLAALRALMHQKRT